MGEHLVRVGHHGEVGQLHHRAVRVGVHADDVVGVAEAAGVLHCATHPERQVQLRVDHHAGGADLSLVRHPAAVGDDAGGADTRADGAAQRGQPIELLG